MSDATQAPTLCPPAPPLLVDTKEAARLSGVGRTLWLQLASAGRVPLPVRLGRRVLWRRDELADWIEAGCPGRDRWIALREKTRGSA